MTLDIRRIMESLPHRYPFLLLDRVVSMGWRVQWRWETELNANFIALRDAPGFRRIISRLEDDAAAQRRHLRATGGL